MSGGITSDRATTATAELYDARDGRFRPAACLGLSRSRHIAVLLEDGTVLVAGGRTSEGVGTSTTECYDPATDRWSAVAAMSVPRDNFTATVLADGRVLVAGGVDGAKDGVPVEKSTEIYDPRCDTWTPAENLAQRRFNHAAVRLGDGRVLVAGGAGSRGDGVYSRLAELFDPVTFRWEPADPMTSPRGLPALALLPDGRVLAAGGLTKSTTPATGLGATDTVEYFDPGRELWTIAPTMGSTRRVFGFAQLDDGAVLVAGGRDDSGTILSSSELFEPSAGLWIPVGSMNETRVGVVLTALSDGWVLATGGGGATPLASAELCLHLDHNVAAAGGE